MNKHNQKISFTRVKKTHEHIKILYDLLISRTPSISHCKIPDMRDHKKFVLNHPYRAWYLVKISGEYQGTIYLLKSNSIGIYLNDYTFDSVRDAINFIIYKFEPLGAKASVRANSFHINVAPQNLVLRKILEKIGSNLIQETYSLGHLRKVF